MTSLLQDDAYLIYFSAGLFIHSKAIIDEAFDIFKREIVYLLPVIDDQETRHLLGIVTQVDVLTIFKEVK